MGRQARVFTGQDPALISDELAEQRGILEVQCIDREVDFGFRTRGPFFHGTPSATVTVLLLGIGFARHRGLLDLAVDSVPPQSWVVLLELDLLGLKFFVPSRRVARGGLPFLACFSAF